MKQKLSQKIFNIVIIIVIIVTIIFTALMMILNYKENGERNMPFNISKISIISTVDGKDNEDQTNKWNLQVNQNNDIYIYIEKNNNYGKTELINSIIIDNFEIQKPNIGSIIIYKPALKNTALFENSNDNKVEELTIFGDKSTDIQNLKISNQGGIIAFRCANDNIANYISSEDEVLDYKSLLQKLEINEEGLRAKIFFDIKIKLESGKEYKAEKIEIEIPVQNIVEQGTTSIEKTDLNNIIFKRSEK